MIAEIGHFAFILAFTLALMQSFVPLYGYFTKNRHLMLTSRGNAIIQFLLITLSFALLITLFLQSDFSVKLVWSNSHTAQPLLYKITSTWGNHEGSMLLWILILTFFASLVALYGKKLPLTLQSLVLTVQGWVTAGFCAFTLFTSNPFERLAKPPLQGQDLNPILQDLGLAIHPPLLYAGYVGFSIAFSFAVAALIEGRIDSAWARWVRPWTLVAWVFLTIGISMGSWWAYYELGWGGFWFWDPVENASLLPWLTGTALLHSAIVMEKRNSLPAWTLLLAIITFSLSLLGTFLVRSGVLTSVHSFASDPTRGIFILMLLLFFVGGALALYALRAKNIASQGLFQPISREGALVYNNLLLSSITVVVLVGTLYPLAIEAYDGSKISVGPPFFNLATAPLAALLALALPFGPMLAWKRGDLLAIAQRLSIVAAIALLIGLIILWYHTNAPILAVIGLSISFWLVFGAFYELFYRAQFGKVAFSQTMRRLINLPRASWGTALAHAGVGISLLGVVATTGFQTEIIRVVNPNESYDLAGYNLTFVRAENNAIANYREQSATFTVSKAGVKIAELTPSKRFYITNGQATTEAGILHLGFSQIFITLGDQKDNGAYAISSYYKPYVSLIWFGSIIMFIGGCLSLFDRRLRIGVGKKNKKVALDNA